MTDNIGNILTAIDAATNDVAVATVATHTAPHDLPPVLDTAIS